MGKDLKQKMLDYIGALEMVNEKWLFILK